MHTTYDQAMQRGVFPHEGGYTNNPADPGGPTKFGITIADARKYWKPGATAADVKAMPKQVAEDIYAKHYAAPLRYDDLPPGVDYAVLDYGINSGVGRAGKVLRRVCALSDKTSVIDDGVNAAVKARDPVRLIAAICDERLKFLQSLRTWPAFGKGWGRRVAEVRALALYFAAQEAAAAQSAPALPPVVAAPDIAPSTTPAKGIVPAPKTAGVIAGGTAAPMAAGATWYDWIAAHPAFTAVIALGLIAAIAAIVIALERAHRSQQEAATPGIVPVPVAA